MYSCNSFIVFSKISSPNIPVLRENDLIPLGHSGHRKLQDVVGSMLILIGNPQCIGLFIHFDK